MTNLFIIGNGFDIAHGMQTKYLDFRQFLIDKYSINKDVLDNCLYQVLYSGQISVDYSPYNKTEVAAIIIKILDLAEGENWKNIETALGKLDYSEFLDMTSYFENPEDEDFIKNTYCMNEDNAISLCSILRLTNIYFEDWVKTIALSNYILKDFKDLIAKEKSFFLNFNYTSTLEELYKVQNVCHIHGTPESNIYFGHGNDEIYTDDFQKKWFGAEDELNLLQKFFRKNTILAYKDNESFFNQIKEEATKAFLNIYSFGFSFSPVDGYYLKQICNLIDTTKTTWFINDFDTVEDRNIFKNILFNCGYKGNIQLFHINPNRIVPIDGLFKNITLESTSQ